MTSSTIVSKGPCPKCGSSDNCKEYDDGHKHCFTPGCGYHTGPTLGDDDDITASHRANPSAAIDAALLRPGDGKFADLKKRRLEAATLRKFNYFVAAHKGKDAHVSCYYDQSGNLVRQKLRYPSKDFPQLKAEDAPSIIECKLFGQEYWGDRFDKRLVICTGELDAMTVAQVMSFKSAAVVSVNNGDDSATANLKANYRWVDSFDEIILFFDNDESGQRAVEPCAKLFKVGKVKVAKIEGFKDASDAMQADQPGLIVEAVYGAALWKPRGIVNAADCLEDLLAENAKTWSYPWPKTTEMIGGILPGELIILISGTGMGKSTLSYELVDHLIHKEGLKCGVMSFEGNRRKIMNGLMAAHVKVRVHLTELTAEQKTEYHKKTFGTRKIELFDPKTAEWSMEAIQGYVRYMAKALDCDVIVIDPLSFLAARQPNTNNEVAAMDRTVSDFAALGQELGVAIIMSHHLRKPNEGKSFEEGATISLTDIRGSGSIQNFASAVLALEGNQQGLAPTLRRYRVLKARETGDVGISDRLEFNRNTGCYDITNKDYQEESGDDEEQKPKRRAFTEY